MFCEDCGTKKTEQNAQFCHNCGLKVAADIECRPPARDAATNNIEFYSKDWRRIKTFPVASIPYFDVMADGKYLYIIVMPKHSGSTFGLFIGLFLLNLLGAVIGSYIGSSLDAKKRESYRSAWLNSQFQLTSQYYEKNILIKIPLNDLKGTVVIEKKKFILPYGDKKIVLARSVGSFGRATGKAEFDRFKQYIEKYVL